MPKFFMVTLLCFFLTIALSACSDKEEQAQTKVEKAVEYDQFGNEVLYTADGEKELINEDCD